MGTHENLETVNTTKHESRIDNHDAFVMERNPAGHWARDHKTLDQVDERFIPKLSIVDSANDYRTGKEVASWDLRDGGIKCRRFQENDGATATKADYGNGVIITSVEGGKPTDLGNGHTLKFKNNMAIEVHYPNLAKLNGDVTDADGRIIAKHNKDGSYTVDTGKGFFTQYADGTIRKESAIRSRDGKSFEVIDTETPLGNLRPSSVR